MPPGSLQLGHWSTRLCADSESRAIMYGSSRNERLAPGLAESIILFVHGPSEAASARANKPALIITIGNRRISRCSRLHSDLLSTDGAVATTRK